MVGGVDILELGDYPRPLCRRQLVHDGLVVEEVAAAGFAGRNELLPNAGVLILVVDVEGTIATAGRHCFQLQLRIATHTKA